MMKKTILTWLAPLVALLFPTAAYAAEEITGRDAMLAVDAVWVMVACVLVFFMQAGFALLEAGATRMKNAGHIAGKNVLSFGIVTLVFWAVGFGLSFGDGNGFFGTTGFFTDVTDPAAADSFSSLSFTEVPLAAKFMFHLVFAGVSLAIMWGGIAERAKLAVYFIFGALFIGVIYPVIAHWVWGGGWLGQLGMQDFAGSTVVHVCGGVAALVGALLLGPRIGKYNKDGSSNLIPGHNTVYAVLGVIILWFGWFGFNGGSTFMANGNFFPYVTMTTTLAASAGAVAALLTVWFVLGKPDIGYMLNGVLAALVAITASCAFVKPWAAVVIGLLAGVFMVFSVLFFDRVAKVDDPVGAFSVHGVAGIWGTLSTGFFAAPDLVEQLGIGKPGLFYGGGFEQLGVQALGLVAAFAFVFVASYVIMWAIKKTIGLRISREEEIIGLDVAEHGASGYPEQLPHGGDFARKSSV